MTSILSTNAEPVAPLGRATEIDKTPGHWVLARLGKRVLRPGGIELTRRMLEALAISSSDDVVEFAPGLGATARLTLKNAPASFVAVERDEQAARSVQRILHESHYRCIVGRAQSTGLPSGCASVVYGEAMLTMQPFSTKERIVAEAARLLKRGGRYGIHELAIVPENLDETLAAEVAGALTGTVHHHVEPLTVASWRQLLQSHGMNVTAAFTAPMHLLEPVRIIQDEGFRGAMRFALNLCRNREARVRVKALRGVFRKYRDNLAAVALVGVKA